MSETAGTPDRQPAESAPVQRQGRRSYRVEVRSDAPVEAVWPLLARSAHLEGVDVPHS